GWLLSKTPERADLVETLNDHLGRFVPVGQAYYDETFLPARLRNNLLVARWCTKNVTCYPLKADGATFKADEGHVLDAQDEARPVGVCVGRGGRIFTTICYMAQNEGSPIYKSDLVMITRKDDPPTAPFEPYDAVEATDEKLWSELQNPSWHRRYAAHVELFRRDKLLAEEKRVADRASGPTGGDSEQSPTPVVEQLRDLVNRYDQNPGTVDDADIIDAQSSDTFVRQIACLRLSERADIALLEKLCKGSQETERMAGVLATGFRLTMPPATSELPAEYKLDKLREEAAYTPQFADAKVDLRKLGPVGNFTIADEWKQAPHSKQQEQMFDLLVKAASDTSEPVRLQAVYFLSLLDDPRSEATVASVITANEERRLGTAKLQNITKAWIAGPFDDGDDGFERLHDPERGPVDVASVCSEGDRSVHWQIGNKRPLAFHDIFGEMDRSSVYVYFRVESGHRQRAHLCLGSDDGVKVWQNGTPVWINDVVRSALPAQDNVSVELQPGSNDFLVRVRNVVGTCQLYLSYRSLADVAIVLPEKIDGPSLAERLAASSSGTYSVPAEFLQVDWTKAAKEGDADRGRALFETIGCAKCHAVSNDAQGTGGPSLADAAKRFTISHLVESILTPNKLISPVFRST
ncbi:MAG TPA: c-type cytochrome, partial [Pirellulales bacterium]|nr:c-type cytochrome [Pirellulales bacterium]